MQEKKNVLLPNSIISSSSMLCSTNICSVGHRNQSCAHMRASTILGVKQLRNGSSIRPPVLKADSEATVETGIANTSRAIRERTRYLDELTFHQFNISKKPTASSQSSFKYLSNSVFGSETAIAILYFLYKEARNIEGFFLFFYFQIARNQSFT